MVGAIELPGKAGRQGKAGGEGHVHDGAWERLVDVVQLVATIFQFNKCCHELPWNPKENINDARNFFRIRQIP